MSQYTHVRRLRDWPIQLGGREYMMESPPYLLEVGETSARDVEARIKREMDQVFPSRNVHVRVDDTLLGATVCVNPALPLPERWWLGPPALRVPPTRGW